MSEPRCGCCGPYTPIEAALMIRGEWQPLPTEYRCAECSAAISRAAKALADRIDAEAFEYAMRQVGNSRSAKREASLVAMRARRDA